MACPLCTNKKTEFYCQDKQRNYHQCPQCQLVFVPPQHHLDHDAEKKVYDLHQNSPRDTGYRQFLNKLLKPLARKLPIEAKGLDFGCGPGPTIKPMMEELGYQVSNYDIYYAKNSQALKKTYDFITCTEAIEHFVTPRKELLLLHSLLRAGGYMGIMTKRVTTKEAFEKWHYKNDPTHICFFSEHTFRWIGKWLGYSVDFPGNDTVIMQKL